ncbi:MAG: SDR family NAD(P)-dependent oxidoreductase, partial [Candidatus Aenigmatarchaeota archaeon]
MVSVDTSTEQDMFLTPQWIITPQLPQLPAKNFSSSIIDDVLIIKHKQDFGLSQKLQRLHPEKNITEIDLEECNSVSEFKKIISSIRDVFAVYFLGGLELENKSVFNSNQLEKAQEFGVKALFRFIKALISSGKIDKLIDIKIITNNIYSVTLKEEELYPFSSSVIGLAKTLSREFSHLKVETIDVAKEDLRKEVSTVAKMIKEQNNNSKNLADVAIRDKVRYHREMMPVELFKTKKNSSFRQEGVYLIAGGANGIGMEVAKHLAKNYQAKLILLGRRKFDKNISSKIKTLKDMGGRVEYFSVDISDKKQMQNARERIRNTFGPINGVIHSAFVLKDSTLFNMQEEKLSQVLAPKVEGTLHLYELVRQEKLDFFTFFSSYISFFGAPGQSNYTSASTFQDNFAFYLSYDLNIPAQVINWIAWKDTGAVSSDYYLNRFEESEIELLTSEEGVRFFDDISASSYRQLAMRKSGNKDIQSKGIYRLHSHPAPLLLNKIHSSLCRQVRKLHHKDHCQNQQSQVTSNKLNSYARLHLLYSLQQMGALRSPKETYSRKNLAEKLNIIPRYHRLLEAIVDILANAGYIYLQDGQVITTDKAKKITVKGLKEKEDLIKKENSSFKGILNLISTCLKGYPQVLTGKKYYTEVMFPQGSNELVEKIYQGDANNNVLATGIFRYIQEKLNKDPGARINILEVGAGTGSTTNPVLKKIIPYRDRINYDYTDISSNFTQHGKKRFQKDYSFLDFKQLDIEKDSASQGFCLGGYDIVLAANVFHATTSIQNTLNNTKKLLKTNGLLFLNESTFYNDIITLTFGLTSGWWLYEDEALRIKNSPLLTQDMWQKVLNNSGFNTPSWVNERIMVAESNGYYVDHRQSQEKKKHPSISQERQSTSSLEKPQLQGRKNQKDYTDTEFKVAQVWQKVLGHQEFNINDNFFEIGGDSL